MEKGHPVSESVLTVQITEQRSGEFCTCSKELLLFIPRLIVKQGK